MLPFAPRYPGRLHRLIDELDENGLSLAELARRVGDAAQAQGLTRPSAVHVRRLAAELRQVREDERELRRATLEAFTRTLPYRPPTPLEVQAARERVRRDVRRREHRKSR